MTNGSRPSKPKMGCMDGQLCLLDYVMHQTFMRAITQVLQPFICQFLVLYFDDMLIHSKTKEEHLFHLQQVIRVLWQEKLYINLKKCSFMVPALVIGVFCV